MWARVAIAYNFKMKKGSLTLVEVYLYAAATMRFNPSPALLYGELQGKVRILGFIKFDFDEDFEIEV